MVECDVWSVYMSRLLECASEYGCAHQLRQVRAKSTPSVSIIRLVSDLTSYTHPQIHKPRLLAAQPAAHDESRRERLRDGVLLQTRRLDAAERRGREEEIYEPRRGAV